SSVAARPAPAAWERVSASFVPMPGVPKTTVGNSRKMAKGRALMTSMVAVAAGKGVTAIAGLLTIMVLTRELGPHEFGYYRTVLTYAAFASVLADLGIYLVGLREMSKPGADAARVIGNALLLRLVSTAGVLLASAVVALALPYDTVVKQGIF